MLALVKKPHIEIRGDIPEQLLTFICDYFGREAVEIIPDDEELLNPDSSPWFAETTIHPGEALRIYREIHGMTQAVLGAKLGGIDRHEISKMETGKRNISVKTAKRLSKLFRVSVERFL